MNVLLLLLLFLLDPRLTGSLNTSSRFFVQQPGQHENGSTTPCSIKTSIGICMQANRIREPNLSLPKDPPLKIDIWFDLILQCLGMTPSLLLVGGLVLLSSLLMVRHWRNVGKNQTEPQTEILMESTALTLKKKKANQKRKERRKKNKKLAALMDHNHNNYFDDDRCYHNKKAEVTLRKVHSAVEKMENSEYFKTSINTLCRCLPKYLNKSSSDIQLIVCYGLGSMSNLQTYDPASADNPIHQFAFMVCVSRLLKIDVEFFDPLFTDVDKHIISKEFQFTVLNVNERGRRTVEELTLFSCPFGSYGIINGVLHANWNPRNLENVVLITNGFHQIADNLRARRANYNPIYFGYIKKVTSETVLVEKPLLFSPLEYPEAFTRFSVHIFPSSMLQSIVNEQNFWSIDEEFEQLRQYHF